MIWLIAAARLRAPVGSQPAAALELRPRCCRDMPAVIARGAGAGGVRSGQRPAHETGGHKGARGAGCGAEAGS